MEKVVEGGGGSIGAKVTFELPAHTQTLRFPSTIIINGKFVASMAISNPESTVEVYGPIGELFEPGVEQIIIGADVYPEAGYTVEFDADNTINMSYLPDYGIFYSTAAYDAQNTYVIAFKLS